MIAIWSQPDHDDPGNVCNTLNRATDASQPSAVDDGVKAKRYLEGLFPGLCRNTGQLPEPGFGESCH